MSMFDYDARPVTPGVVLVGTPASRGGYAIRDFLSRNGYPFEWVDAGQPGAVRAVLGVAEVEPSALPLCILPDGSRLASATVEQVAAGLGMVAAPSRSEYDLTIVGAGPAGLAAAVNAALPGVFAAGDVRCGSVKRCPAAIGEGSMAVALVHRRLAELGGD
jgi:thioredoxin reductase (NADPH)